MKSRNQTIVAFVSLIWRLFLLVVALQPAPALAQPAPVLTLPEAMERASRCSGPLGSSLLNEAIVLEDVQQAVHAMNPKLSVQAGTIFTTPSLGPQPPGGPRLPSYLGANAVTEDQALLVMSGEFDTSGRLHALVEKQRSLLIGGELDTKIAQRDLAFQVATAYYSASLMTSQRQTAEENLAVATKFQNTVKLQFGAGEVAQVDLLRANLQVGTRRDELEQASRAQRSSLDKLRVLIGYSTDQELNTQPLTDLSPPAAELGSAEVLGVENRAELTRVDIHRDLAQIDITLAKAERRPQLRYALSGGTITDALNGPSLRNHVGLQGQIAVTFPLFDSGISRSKEKQAELKLQQLEIERDLKLRQYRQDLATGRDAMDSAQMRLKQLSLGMDEAQQNVEISMARYRLGEAPIIEVIDAQNLLTTRRQAVLQALFDFLMAQAAVDRAASQ